MTIVVVVLVVSIGCVFFVLESLVGLVMLVYVSLDRAQVFYHFNEKMFWLLRDQGYRNCSVIPRECCLWWNFNHVLYFVCFIVIWLRWDCVIIFGGGWNSWGTHGLKEILVNFHCYSSVYGDLTSRLVSILCLKFCSFSRNWSCVSV